MNNTKKTRTLAMFAVLTAATLVVGTFATTLVTKSALASKSGNTVTAQINIQDGTQSGFDNKQSQESQNVICTHPGDNASCVQEGAAGAAAQAPVKLTCEQCFTKLLTTEQIQRFIGNLDDFPHTLETVCSFAFNELSIRTALGDAGVSRTVQDELIACLLQAGITITPSKA